MEIETLFTEQKWKILSALSKGKYSPMQLAERSNTTMANISQQLRLLEFSNLVKKEKIPNRDKGKPRSLFSLSDDYAYLISVMNGFAEKKLVKLDNLHKIIFRILFFEDQELCYYVEKFVWSIEESLEVIDMIMLKPSEDEINVVIVTKDTKEIERKIKDTVIKKPKGKSKNFKVKILSRQEAEKLAKQKKGIFSELEDLFIIYDPQRVISKLKDGGDI